MQGRAQRLQGGDGETEDSAREEQSEKGLEGRGEAREDRSAQIRTGARPPLPGGEAAIKAAVKNSWDYFNTDLVKLIVDIRC